MRSVTGAKYLLYVAEPQSLVLAVVSLSQIHVS